MVLVSDMNLYIFCKDVKFFLLNLTVYMRNFDAKTQCLSKQSNQFENVLPEVWCEKYRNQQVKVSQVPE